MCVRHAGRDRTITIAAGIWTLLLISCTCGRTCSANEFVADPFTSANLGDYVDPSRAAELWRDWPEVRTTSPSVWTVDYRFRSLQNSYTSYEFGTPDPPPTGWTPLSRLAFPLDSTWHGVQVELQKPTWDVRCELLFPQHGIHGNLADYDWQNPGETFTDLGYAQQRWTDGQMLDLSLEFEALGHPWGLPLEVWPVLGFRWQRFDLMCSDAVQVKADDQWLDPPFSYPGDVLSFNQQYYMAYFGGQIRERLEIGRLPPIALTFQADGGFTEAYNIDHHLIREGDRYTMERTHGGSWHVAIISEALISRHFSVGFQADFLEIRTSGTHRLVNAPLDTDVSWDNGVAVSSNQTWLTAFLRLRI
jgi:hypothetical protein